MAWGVLLAAIGVGLVTGLLAKRWWVVAAWAAIAAGHAAWILLSGQETTQNSSEELAAISAVYFYAPLVGGSAVGTMIARVQSRRDGRAPLGSQRR